MYPLNAVGFVSLQKGGRFRSLIAAIYYFFYRRFKESADFKEIEAIIEEFPIDVEGRRVIFIHNPKCAGKSVSSVLRPDKLISHIPAWKYERYFESRSLRREDYLLFAVVREPVQRFLSAYRFYKTGGFKKDNLEVFTKEGPEASRILNDFVSSELSATKSPDDLVFLPQSYFICDDRNKVLVDVLFQNSSLNSEFSIFYESRFGSKLELPNRNTTSTGDGPLLELSDESIKRLRKVYETDFDLAADEEALTHRD